MKFTIKNKIKGIFLLIFLITSANIYAYDVNDYGEIDLPISGTIHNVPADYPTINAAVNAALPGDTVLVSSGTYNENLNLNYKAISLISSDGPETTIIRGVSGTVINAGPGGKIYGFTISNGNGGFGAGISVRSSGLEIKYNIFKDNTGGTGTAIGGNSASAIIEHNIFTNNTCDSQFLSGVVSFVNTSSPYIANNIFDSNQCRAINFTVPSSASPIVINNTIVRNSVGIYVDRRINSIKQKYRNNIVYGNDIGIQMRFGRDSYNPVFENNLVYNNTTDYLNTANQTGIKGNISTAPLFVDPLSDLHLQRNSPAIDAGSFVNAPSLDFDGDDRPFDGNGDGIASVDIGADEYSTNLTISIAGGTIQECSSTGGNSVEVIATLTTSDDPVVSITWFVDNIEAGSGSTTNIFVPVGTHEVLAKAVTVSGKTYDSSATIEVNDTIAPAVNSYFLDSRSNKQINIMDSPNVQWVITKFDVTDICDANPAAQAIGGMKMINGLPVKIQGNLNTITMETNKLFLQVIGTDASGNNNQAQSFLTITD